MQRVRHANRGRLLLWTPGPVPLWDLHVSNVETNLSWACLVSGPLNFEHPSVLLFCFQSEEAVLWRRAPSLTYLCHILDPPLGGVCRSKSLTTSAGLWVLYPYQVPIHMHALVHLPFLHLNKYIKKSLKILKHLIFYISLLPLINMEITQNKCK